MSGELITKKDADSIQGQREALSKWLRMAHEKPENVCVNKFANNTKYVPVSYVEMKLDELFIDGWNLEIKSVQQVLNSVVVTVRISGLNPATGREFFRDGIGSKALQLKKGSPAMDISSIQPNACELGFPAAKAQALKNAAQSIGKVFGRDVAREIEDEYNPIVKTAEDKQGSYVSLTDKWSKTKVKNQAVLDSFLKEAQKQGIYNEFLNYVKGANNG